MYVCHCHAVTDRDIHDAVDAGAMTVDEVSDATGAATNCGGCFETVESVLLECRASCPLFAAAVA